MSKLDAQRALREAHYARGGATPPRPGATPTQSAKKTVRTPTERPPVAPESPSAEGAEAPNEALCGHKAISGRTCTREAGHSAKSHRYA
ncbi:hypothetical protein [Nocardioides sp. AX2bis]|uniref:hypothetical protein n=1 Tax=Nocardioides sp. AX2bis TaxID=2653157 RepID=UPI0012F033E6|nr:hypothetical protein [Nocardioides sp. AX2bis]VXB53406.1 conserved hypothetical protein [Nocardioides sp. AX2bis]